MIEAGRQKRGCMGVVTMGNIEEKNRIMRNKWKLKGRDIWIQEDLTWKERKMRWMIKRRLKIGVKRGEKGPRGGVGKGGNRKGMIEKGEQRNEEGGEKGIVRGGGGEKGVRIMFWNVPGLGNKDREFSDNLKRWDAMVLMETWVEGKGEKKLRERLPDGYVQRIEEARRRNKKGRAMGGMIMRIKRELYVGERERKEVEGMMTGVMKTGESRVRVVGVYINMDLQSKLEGMVEWMEEREEGVKTVIGGDFNVRTGREGGRITEEIEGEEEEERRSKDSKVNKEGRKLVGFIRERGWAILNGNIQGDEEDLYRGKGGINDRYVLVDEEAREQIESMKGDAVESDHHPLIVTWKGEKEKGKNKGKEGREVNRGVWDEEGKMAFRERLGVVEWREGRGEENMKETEERIREVLGSIEKERDKERKGRGWWDNECKEKKKRVRRVLREWRKGNRNGEEYRREKREYKELCELFRKEENERWERKVEGAKREGQVWEIVNGEKKKWKGINKAIEMREWEKYFKELLGGVERRVVRGKNIREGQKGERELSREEIRKVTRNLKDGKTMGVDGMPNKVWKYGGEEMEEWVWRGCNEVWKGGMARGMERGSGGAGK
ncbi:hypothetical protein ALC57_05605 [Trachymyrmex cornetzi]|uniref:Endonuclease/exonuclease/phosphatase domain-containing protein n=1 Tax=Trachymyrmex cornetzi TaxID=471704 RepID=A0A151JAB4_9HYME|nr:hypothetical protein ALC57_05605 [Trachymyrmex cornetzi]